MIARRTRHHCAPQQIAVCGLEEEARRLTQGSDGVTGRVGGSVSIPRCLARCQSIHRQMLPYQTHEVVDPEGWGGHRSPCRWRLGRSSRLSSAEIATSGHVDIGVAQRRRMIIAKKFLSAVVFCSLLSTVISMVTVLPSSDRGTSKRA
jgi:hypothetical protein